jgi:hypothetical protein
MFEFEKKTWLSRLHPNLNEVDMKIPSKRQEAIGENLHHLIGSGSIETLCFLRGTRAPVKAAFEVTMDDLKQTLLEQVVL